MTMMTMTGMLKSCLCCGRESLVFPPSLFQPRIASFKFEDTKTVNARFLAPISLYPPSPSVPHINLKPPPAPYFIFTQTWRIACKPRAQELPTTNLSNCPFKLTSSTPPVQPPPLQASLQCSPLSPLIGMVLTSPAIQIEIQKNLLTVRPSFPHTSSRSRTRS